MLVTVEMQNSGVGPGVRQPVPAPVPETLQTIMQKK